MRADEELRMTVRQDEKENGAAVERRVTREVGSEGGSAGEVEVADDRYPAAGTEGTETVQPTKNDLVETAHDETEEGRRTP
jgi:hypothetical protein